MGPAAGAGRPPWQVHFDASAVCFKTSGSHAAILSLLSAAHQVTRAFATVARSAIHHHLPRDLQDRVGGAGPARRCGARVHGRAARVL